MPFYTVRKKEQPEIVSPLPLMKWEELQQFLSDNPEYEQVIVNAPAVKVH
jgi:hypothetical protein